MSQWLVEWVRFFPDSVGDEPDSVAEAYVVEMTDEEAEKIHEEVYGRGNQDLVVNPAEITSYKDLRKLVGLR